MMSDENVNPDAASSAAAVKRARRKHLSHQNALKRERIRRIESIAARLSFLACMVFIVWAHFSLAHIVSRQLRSEHFTETTAEVTHSERIGKKGSRIQIRYSIGIEAEMLDGELETDWLESIKSRDLLVRYPLNARVPLFYNEQQPDEFALVRGLRGTDVFRMMCVSLSYPFLVSFVLLLRSLTPAGLKRERQMMRLKPGAKYVDWSFATTMAVFAYFGGVAFTTVYLHVFDKDQITVAAASTTWLVIAVISVAGFVWFSLPRTVKSNEALIRRLQIRARKERMDHWKRKSARAKQKKDGVNSSSDRAAPGSA